VVDADLDAIEAYLGLPLPEGYRILMRAYPLDPADINARRALIDDVLDVLAFNAELREGEFASEWSPERCVIGCSPCGDSYFLDLTGRSPAVFVWDHETHEISEEAANLDQFVQQWTRPTPSTAENQPPPARWWQFWR
jgi:hypothetical protein